MIKSVKKDQEVLENSEENNTEISSFEQEAKIAQLAYLKAESRGFTPGYELNDWLEAEQELNPSRLESSLNTA